MKDAANRPTQGIGPDDPRLSEWIDGRLDPATADEVRRAVQARPELAALVEELRSLKVVLAGHETAPPPAGFVGRVMDAVNAAGDSAADPAVEAEWRRLEDERLSEERAEAREDASEPTRPPLPRWGWLAIAGALAAGLVVAVLVNLPRDGGREVAMVENGPAARPIRAPTTEAEDADAGFGDGPATAAPAEEPAATVPRAADALATRAKPAESALRRAEQPPIAARALTAAAPADELESGSPQRESKAASFDLERAPGRVAFESSGSGSGSGAAAPLTNSATAGIPDRPLPRVVVVRVDGARGRAALARLISAGGLSTRPAVAAPAAVADEQLREAGGVAATTERIDVAGSRQSIADLLASLMEARGDSGFALSADGERISSAAKAIPKGRGQGAAAAVRENAAGDAASGAKEPSERIVIVIVENPALQDPALRDPVRADEGLETPP